MKIYFTERKHIEYSSALHGEYGYKNLTVYEINTQSIELIVINEIEEVELEESSYDRIKEWLKHDGYDISTIELIKL